MHAFRHLVCGALLTVLIYSAFGNDYLELFSKKVEEFEGKIIHDFSRLIMNGESLIYCHFRCLEDAECMSFFHNRITGRCQTHGVVFFNPDKGELLPGSQYFKPFQDICPSNLGYIYNRALDLCYKIHFDNKGNSSFAHQVCQDEGADLIITDTKEKLYHIGQTIKGSPFHLADYADPLIGAKKMAPFNSWEWEWEDGQQFNRSYPFWCPGEPNNSKGNENFVVIKFTESLTGCIDDASANYVYHFICERKKQ